MLKRYLYHTVPSNRAVVQFYQARLRHGSVLLHRRSTLCPQLLARFGLSSGGTPPCVASDAPPNQLLSVYTSNPNSRKVKPNANHAVEACSAAIDIVISLFNRVRLPPPDPNHVHSLSH